MSALALARAHRRRPLSAAHVAAVVLPLAGLLSAPAARAAPRTVRITPTRFDPAVVVVAPGTRVDWINTDARPRALRGDFSSPPVAPGSRYRRRFARVGRYDYRDRENAALTGTVIVAGSAGRRPRYPEPGGSPTRVVEHRWRVTLRYTLRENWRYMDGKFLSFDGVCNAEVGDGSRTVAFSALFPNVRYRRVGRLEVLSGTSRITGIRRYRELINAKTSDPTGGRSVDCGDGSRDPPPDVPQRCDHDYAGTRVRAELLWSPHVADGRFAWPHSYLGTGPPDNPNCGVGFLAAGSLVGLNPDLLPWDPGAGARLLYDHGRTGPATRAEARALRDGRALTVERGLEVRFTTDCCVGWNEPSKPGTYARAGARYVVQGRVTIRFTPRGP